MVPMIENIFEISYDEYLMSEHNMSAGKFRPLADRSTVSGARALTYIDTVLSIVRDSFVQQQQQ